MLELSQQEINRLRERAKNDLYFLARGILGFNYMVPHVHMPVCEFLMRPTRRKQLTMPRGFLKTTTASVAYPIWRAIRNPDIRILIAMKTLPNAMKTINQIRTIFDRNELFRALFPELLPTRDLKWSDEVATINRPGAYREGTFEAAGIGTTVTSRHYNLIIEDDLVAPDKDDMTGLDAMPTRDAIEKAIGWHRLARSLLINLETDEIFNVGTRWSKYDLIQHIIDHEPRTDRLELSAIKEDGSPAYPERFPLNVLEEIEAEQGTYIFSSQYLNKPYDESRMIFRPEWLSNTWEHPLPKEVRKVLIVDPAISQKREAANTAIIVAGAYNHQLYAIDYKVGKFNPSQTIDHMFQLADQHSVLDVFVESVAWQEALLHFFELEARARGVWLNVDELRPKSDESKDMRIRGLQPFARRGALLLAPWMRELKVELQDFPFSNTKDLADALAYAPRALKLALATPKPKPPAKRGTGQTMGEVIDIMRRRKTRRFGLHVPRVG